MFAILLLLLYSFKQDILQNRLFLLTDMSTQITDYTKYINTVICEVPLVYA